MTDDTQKKMAITTPFHDAQLCDDIITEIVSYLPMTEVARLNTTSMAFMQAFLLRFTRVSDKYLILTQIADINSCTKSGWNKERTLEFFVGAIIVDYDVVPFSLPVYDMLLWECDGKTKIVLANSKILIDNDKISVCTNRGIYTGKAIIPCHNLQCRVIYLP